jgi:GT2 family glycosyltransferase
MQEQSKVAIVILNWNGKKDTLHCLASLQKLTYKNVEIIVVDNGSRDDSVVAIQANFPHITLIQSKQNLGFAGGNNLGIEYALKTRAEFLFLLNNDTEVDPNIVTAYFACMEKHPQAGILGAKTYLFDQRTQFDHFGGFWNQKKAVFDLVANRAIEDGVSWEKELPLDYACGCSLFIRKAVFEQVGLLEEKFFLIWEEADFCFRARKAGFMTFFCPQAKLWHRVSASFVGGKPHSTYFWWRNRLLWIERNCSLKEKLSLYFRVLLREIGHLAKLRAIKSVEWSVLRMLHKTDQKPEKRERLIMYRAALAGIRDYCLRRFGNGPAWIYQNGNKKSSGPNPKTVNTLP